MDHIANECLLNVLTHFPAYLSRVGIVGAPPGTPLIIPSKVASSTALPFAAPIAGAPAPKRIKPVAGSGSSDSGSESGRWSAPAAAARPLARGSAAGALLRDPSSKSTFERRRVPVAADADGSASILTAAVRGLDAALDSVPRSPSGACDDEQHAKREDEAVRVLRADVSVAAAAAEVGLRVASDTTAATAAEMRTLTAVANSRQCVMRVFTFATGSATSLVACRQALLAVCLRMQPAVASQGTLCVRVQCDPAAPCISGACPCSGFQCSSSIRGCLVVRLRFGSGNRGAGSGGSHGRPQKPQASAAEQARHL